MTVLGSGTLLPDAARHSASFHVDLAPQGVLLDCGTGTVHGLSQHGVDWRSIGTVAISHYHSDHVGDLPALLAAFNFIRRTDPLTIVGPPDLRSFLDRMAGLYGEYILSPGFPVTVVEAVGDEPWSDDRRELQLVSHATPHTEQSVAYRLSGPWGRLGYTGDTGPSNELARFLAGCSVLICECALTDPPDREGHLSPTQVATLATTAEPDVLVLTHVYPPSTPEEARSGVTAHYAGRTLAAYDGMKVRISRDGAVTAPVDPYAGPL